MLSVLFVLSLIASTQLDKIEIQLSAEDMLVQNDPERDYYREIVSQFGDEEIILLYLKDADLAGAAKLTALRNAIDDLEALEFVDRTESLFSVPYLKTVEGYLNKDPYFVADKLPEDEEQSAKLLDKALINPFVKRTLLSEDKSVTAVAIVLTDDLSSTSDQQIVESLNQITKSLQGVYSEVFTIGYQHIRTAVADKIKAEQGHLFPMSVAVLLICLFFLLRQLVDILIPVMTASISILWTLGMMGFFNIPLNVVTSIIPILLIIVGSTEDIHLVSEFRRGQMHGMEKLKAIEKMAVKMGGIVLLTFITTYIGFLSIGLSKIEVLWQFGVLSATALLFNFFITITLIPALLRLTGDWKLDGNSRFLKTPEVGFNSAKNFYSLINNHRTLIAVILIIITSISFYGMTTIKINHNPIDNLNEDSPVKGYFKAVNENLSGLESMSVILDSGIQDTFLKSRYVEELKKLQDFIENQPGIRSTTSFANYLSLLNAAFEELTAPVMPESDEIINELMIFLQHEQVSAYVTEDFSRSRILIRHNLSSTQDIRETVNNIQTYLDTELDKGLRSRITGDSVLTLSATNAMINGQLKSISVLLVSIVLIISVLFLDWKVGVIAAVPNIFPVIVLFGVMGYMDIPLNIGTTMAAAIAIGLAVDDTMHFMLRYNGELKTRRSQLAAMYATLQSEALPVFATSIALTGGFLVFVFSDFEPVRQFGFLSAIVMLTALIADFIITPLVISALRLITVWDMLSLDLRKEVIEKNLLFNNMHSWQIRKFFLSSSILNFKPGETVFQAGDDSDSIYLVLRGEIEIRHHADHVEVITEEIISQGGVFGDISMLAGVPRASDAVSNKQSSLLLVTREGILNATNYHPIIGARLFLNLAVHVSQRFNSVVHDLSQQRKRE